MASFKRFRRLGFSTKRSRLKQKVVTRHRPSRSWPGRNSECCPLELIPKYDVGKSAKGDVGLDTSRYGLDNAMKMAATADTRIDRKSVV